MRRRLRTAPVQPGRRPADGPAVRQGRIVRKALFQSLPTINRRCFLGLPISAVASALDAHYIPHAGLRGASGDIFSGPYRSLRELSLAGPVGSVTWRPPTFVGNPGSSSPTAIAAPHVPILVLARKPAGLS